MDRKKVDAIFASYAERKDGDSPYEVQYRLIRTALDDVVRLDTMVVPKAWLESFPEDVRTTMESIGEHLDPTRHFFAAGAAFANLEEYRAAHGLTYRMFVATMNYFATGEGVTLKLFAHRAHSLGEFIATLDEDPYFVQGMGFFEGMPPADDAAFKAFDTAHLRAMIEDKHGRVRVKLETHVNYS